jgi:DNA-binding beta-propeller fold protein YncE
MIFINSANATVDISNPLNLAFASDSSENFIDVIDIKKAKTIYRINTPYRADALAVTPYASLLFFTNIKTKRLIVYDLDKRQINRVIKLKVTPRHMVLDSTGKYLAITDSKAGGIVIVNTYAKKIDHQDINFPPTTDVLFDPNEVDLYYTNNQTGSLGILEINSYSSYEINIMDTGNSNLSSPSRSLDGHYLYIADSDSGDIISLNAFSLIIYKTFNIGKSPARPYTTPEGVFLYMLDSESGRFVAIEQNLFTQYSETTLGKGVNLVSVGRFDRMNLLLSNNNTAFFIYDNIKKKVLKEGTLSAIPFTTQGSIDGKNAFIAFKNLPKIAIVELDKQQINYITATNNGAGAFIVGASNNVCH